MRKFLRRIISFFRVPLTRWYLKRDRVYRFRGLTIRVNQGVFHPGLFPSTAMLRRYLEKQDLYGKTLLELGCGTGFLSILAEKAGAIVTASDISEAALNNARANATGNHTSIQFIQSDLFDKIPSGHFDWIVINPPYYRKDPGNEAEQAWFCGKDFDYFRKLFPALTPFVSDQCNVLMTLTADCEIPPLSAIAQDHQLEFRLLETRNTVWDGEDFLFRIIPLKASLF